MAAGALTEPLLPRGHDDSPARPAHATVVDVAAAVPSTTTTPARAASHAAASTATTATRSPPRTLPSTARNSGLPLPASGSSGASAATAVPPTAGSPPPPTLPSPARSSGPPLSASGSSCGGNTGASASTAAPPTAGSPPPTLPSPRRGSHLPLSGSGASATAGAGNAASPLVSPPSPSNRADLTDLSPPTGTPGLPRGGLHNGARVAPPPPLRPAMRSGSSPECSSSSSQLRARSSPRSTANREGVLGDPALRPAGSHSVTIGTQTSRLVFRVARGGRHPHPRSGRHGHRRTGLRIIKLTPKQDFWSKESFMYMCVLMVFAGLVAYLGTMVEGWVSYLRVTFIMVFGIATGLACTGAMALISDTPIPSPRHFAPIVSRLTFLVASLAFEGAVFYLLGEIGFVVWLVVAAGTVFGMAYFWRVGHPDSLDTLLSSLWSILILPWTLVHMVLALVRRV